MHNQLRPASGALMTPLVGRLRIILIKVPSFDSILLIMKRLTKFAAALLISAVSSFSAIAENIAVDGAAPGVWTQDYDAALALAQEKSLPIMLNFTGSDWCGWCQLMDKAVFAKAEWKSWAAKNIVLVQLNYPKNKKLVPEKYVKRNESLSNSYDIEGFPTYVLLGADGKTELGRLGASRDATPEKFIGEVEELVIVWEGIDKYLSDAEFREYSEIEAETARLEKEASDYYDRGLEELKAIHARQESAKSKQDSARISKEFASRKKELEAGMKKLVAPAEKLAEKKQKIVKKAIKAMRAEKKKGAAK